MNETNNLMGSALGALVESKVEVVRLRERVEEQGAELTKLRLKLWRTEDELKREKVRTSTYRSRLVVLSQNEAEDPAEYARAALDEEDRRGGATSGEPWRKELRDKLAAHEAAHGCASGEPRAKE